MSTSSRCLGCAAPLPEPFLDLGETPLANAYVRPENAHLPERRYPLAVAFCPSCCLVQLVHTVPPEELFTEYLYFSSYSDTFLAHARQMADELSARFALGRGSRVVEIASNDGYLLQYFRALGIRVLGVEPARNVAQAAIERGVPTLITFFGRAAADHVRQAFGPADLLIGNNVLAHVPAIGDFLVAVRDCLADDGVAVFEVPYVGTLLDNVEFDTIYHEHVFYFSLTALERLAIGADLAVFDVSSQQVHGGSLRIFLQARQRRARTPAVQELLDAERKANLCNADRYRRFSEQVGFLKASLIERLQALKREGASLAAYGAPAKGNTLLNTCGIGTHLLDFTVDRSPHKQGLLLPGSRLPILAPNELVRRRPDVTLILPWNIADEIVAQQGRYLTLGGRFLVPVPRPVEIRA
jgi:SAM-dependent methyltransferase